MCWAWLKDNEKQLNVLQAYGLLFAAVIAGWIGLSELVGQFEAESRAETMRLRDQYWKGDLYDARKKVIMYWDDPEKIKPIKEAGPKIFNNTIRQMVTDNGWQVHIVLLVDFYQDVVVCVESELCDQDTACSFFAEDITAFKNLYFAPLKDLAEYTSERLLEPLDRFSNEICERN